MQIIDKIIEIARLELGIADISADDRFGDIGADSLEVVSLYLAVAKEFNVDFDESMIAETASELAQEVEKLLARA